MLDVQTNLVKVLIITGVHIVTSKKNMEGQQEPFHAYFADGDHIGETNWVMICTNKSGN